MAVPLPDDAIVNLVPPDYVETELLARAVSTAAAAPEGSRTSSGRSSTRRSNR